MIVQASLELVVTYWNPAARAHTCTSNQDNLVRLGQQVCDILEGAVIAGLDLLERHRRALA